MKTDILIYISGYFEKLFQILWTQKDLMLLSFYLTQYFILYVLYYSRDPVRTVFIRTVNRSIDQVQRIKGNYDRLKYRVRLKATQIAYVGLFMNMGVFA